MASKINPDLSVAITPASGPKSSNPTRQAIKTSQSRLNTTSKKSKHNIRQTSSRYDSRQADAALRQAAEGGYLISPSRAFLLERCKTTDKETRSLREIEYLQLSFMHIRTLGHIQSCRHLRVCILNNNYLTRFSALANCPELIRLDLHSNQITKLPDETFWANLERLKILNLHDNGIGNLDSVQGLSVCARLTVLTLYDTPVSLKPNYRHHTVNSIWTLKALDHHVVSDEEIIEDAQFNGRFRSYHPSLAIDLCPKEKLPPSSRTLAFELKVVKRILRDINTILAHGSPVIVIQRWIRGHLARKRRGIKYNQIVEKLRKHSRLSATQPTPGEGYDIDFDTYMENRRPGSKTPSGGKSRRAESFPSRLQREETADSTDMNIPTSLHINLAKLEKVAMKKLLQQSPDLSEIVHITRGEKPQKGVEFAEQKKDSPSPYRQKARIEQGKPKRRDPQTVQQMLGPKESLVQPPSPSKAPGFPSQHATPGLELGVKVEDLWVNGEQPQHTWRIHSRQFRLDVDKPPAMEIDPMQDHVMMTQEAGRDIREAEEFWHDQQENRPKPVAKKHKPEARYKDQVSLATLIAVSKAYKDRDRADQLALKMDRVLKIQQEKLQAKHIVNAYKEERRNMALNKRQEDRIKVTRALQQQEINRVAYIEYAQERKEKAIRHHQAVHKDLMFAADFSNQHTSVSSALVRHDRQSNMDDIVAEKKEIVKGIQVQLSEQADLVRRYMEHKQLMQQLACGQEKAELGTRALQEANERVLMSKQRVAAMKARKAAMKAFHHPATATTGERHEVNSTTSLMSDGLHPSPSFFQEGGVIFPPTPGRAPNVTPRNTERGSTFMFPRPKTTAVVELPPVPRGINGLQTQSVLGPRHHPILTLST
ncbi:uncharacterized protein LOC120345171 [Styela clava]